jgi:hypothetical protein
MTFGPRTPGALGRYRSQRFARVEPIPPTAGWAPDRGLERRFCQSIGANPLVPRQR